jgi:hypothetical protein
MGGEDEEVFRTWELKKKSLSVEKGPETVIF